jgi:tRNA nucleotidyltransferase (CCA-adding enzyme)
MDTPNPQQSVSDDQRMAHYLKVYESARFEDWDKFHLCLQGLEETILGCFPENRPLMKLVGSSATGTMRRGGEDLDFAVAFQKPIDNGEFLRRVKETSLDIVKVKQNGRYGYLKVSGKRCGMNFVLVPMIHPNGHVQTYEQDAFYHPDFVNEHKSVTHARNVVLMKEFFEQIGVYKEVKGIGCEMMTLHFLDFDSMVQHFVRNSSLRINFSQNSQEYSSAPLVIDYPFLGGRSFTEGVNLELYAHIQESAKRVIDDFKFLKVKQNEQ